MGKKIFRTFEVKHNFEGFFILKGRIIMFSKYLSKIISLLVVVVFTSSVTDAQIKIGLNGGANFAKYTLTNKAPDFDFLRKTGLSIGAIVEYPILENMSVRLNAGYIQRGGKNNIPTLGVNENKFYFDYIELAPYLTYNVINSEIIVKIIGGFSFGHLIDAKGNTGGNDFSLKESLYLFNLTSNFGLEIEKKILQKTSLIFTGIYSIGLKNISKFGNSDLKTSDLTINIGFLYNLY